MVSISLVGCSERKLRVPAPAFMLYGVSPRFSLFYQHAQTKGKVFILSGKLGLIPFDQVVCPYDHKLDLKQQPDWVIKNAERINALHADTIFSYLSGEYAAVLKEVKCANITNMVDAPMFQVASSLGKVGRLKTQDWPIEKIIEFIFMNSPVKVNAVILFIRDNWKHPQTRKLQLQRVLRCPLFNLVNDTLIFKFKEE